jgi:hypothetical protein
VAKVEAKSRFKDFDEWKDYVRRELPRLVEPILKREVDKMFATVQEKVNQRAGELLSEVQNKLLRTWQYQVEQADVLTPATDEPDEPSPKNPNVLDFDQFLFPEDQLRSDFGSLFDLEAISRGTLDCGMLTNDSAYFSYIPVSGIDDATNFS